MFMDGPRHQDRVIPNTVNTNPADILRKTLSALITGLFLSQSVSLPAYVGLCDFKLRYILRFNLLSVRVYLLKEYCQMFWG